MKKCNRCLQDKSFEEFHKAKGNKDGYKNYCRECYKNKIYSYGEKEGEENRKPYEKKGFNPKTEKKGFISRAKPLIVIDGIEGKECNRCEKWKPLTEYHKFRRLTYGLNIYCKDCDRKAKNAYFKTDRGRDTANKFSAKRRSKMKGVKFTPFLRSEILKRDKFICQKCGIKVHDRSGHNWNTPDKANVDHIISLEDGGETVMENLRTLCRTCNLEKGAKSEGVVQMVLF